jgi:hypothetical protein
MMKKSTNLGVAMLFAAAALVGCGGGGDKSEPATTESSDDTKVEETGQELSKNPFKAAAQLGDAAKQLGKKYEEAAKREPVEPVHFNMLLPFLPEPPEDWSAGDPNGRTTSMGEWKTTVVDRTYELEGEHSARMRITITDGGYVPAIYAPFHMMSQFSQESTSGHQKGVTVAGQPGFEKWEKSRNSTDLTLLVADRFVVHLDASGLDPEATHGWVGPMRLDELATLQ